MSDASIENKSDKEHCLVQFVYCLLGSSSYRLRRQRLIGDKRFNSVSKIDQLSRVIFPVSFIVFQTCYWSFYIYANITHMAM